MSGPNKPTNTPSKTPFPNLLGTENKSPKDRPLPTEIYEQKNAELRSLKSTIETRRQIHDSIVKRANELIQNSHFAGKESIQVQKLKDDTSAIFLRSSFGIIQLDFHYDEMTEETDSLRIDAPNPPSISITGTVDSVNYTLEDYTVDNAIRTGSELLKHLERKKNPKVFGFESIDYTLGMNGNITVMGIKADGTGRKLPFFDYINNPKDRLNLYGYLSHYFGKPLDPSVFEEKIEEQPSLQKNPWYTDKFI